MPASTAKRVTAADVARSLGLSRATVGFVLNDTPGQTISQATRERVLAEAKRLGYRANTAARALASGRSRIVLLVLPDWPMDHNLRTNLEEASLALDEAGYSLVTMTPHRSGRAQPLWETLSPDVVMGMLPFSDEQLDGIRASGAICISPSALDAPRLEFAEGPRLQVEHLIERGCRRLAFAGSPDARLAGLVGERRSLAAQTLHDTTGDGFAAVEELDGANASSVISRWLALGVDGVVAYNDDVAARVVGVAIRAGIRVPEQLAVIGHDDTPLAELFVPTLSSVRVDTAGLGRYLAALALSAVNGTPMPEVGPESRARLVPRETT